MRSPVILALLLLGGPMLNAAAWSPPAPRFVLMQTAPTFTPTPAAPAAAVVVASRTAGVIPEYIFYDRLAANDIIYVGERHDWAAHHIVQAEVLAALFARRSSVVVGLEMVSHTDQPTLDAFTRGALTENEFKKFWNKTWGYKYEIYKPIFDFARAHNIPMRALNAPRAVIRQIARGGLNSLTPEQRALIPAQINPIRDPRYLAYVKKSFDGHGPMPPARMAKMLEAQATWNETMAEKTLAALSATGGPVLVVAGSGHMIFGAGISESVRNRAAAAQATVLPYPPDGESRPLRELLRELQRPGSPERSTADYFRLLPGS